MRSGQRSGRRCQDDGRQLGVAETDRFTRKGSGADAMRRESQSPPPHITLLNVTRVEWRVPVTWLLGITRTEEA